MSVIKKVQMAGYTESLRARITDENDNQWDYDLQYNTRTWKDEADYLDNAATDFESEWEVAVKLGLTIDTTELFEKVTEEDDLPINF